MPQLDGFWVILKSAEQSFQTVHRFRSVLEACGKLKQQTSELFRLRQRRDAGSEFLHFRPGPFGLTVRELLPQLDCKFEIVRRPLSPAFGCLGATGPIERGIDLDDVEVPRVKLQLVGFLEGVKNAGPRTGAGTRRITPTARTNADDARGIRRFVKKVARF